MTHTAPVMRIIFYWLTLVNLCVVYMQIYEMTEDGGSESEESKSSSWKHRLCVSVCLLVLVPVLVCLAILLFNSVKGMTYMYM